MNGDFVNFGDGGYYNDAGVWVQTKFCCMPCYERCNCQPPDGIYDLNKVKEDGESVEKTD